MTPTPSSVRDAGRRTPSFGGGAGFAPLAAVTLCLFLTSCLTPTGTQRPAEIVNYGGRGGAGSTGMHTVLEGDTVYTVSEQYNLPLREIISVNQLSPPYRLNMGYRLRLPPPNEYRAQGGDTLNNISRLFNVSVSEMAKLNNIPAPYVVRKGQILRLPTPQPKLQQEFAAPAPTPAFAGGISSGALKVPSVESEVLAAPPGQAGVPSQDAPAGAQVLRTAAVQPAAVTPAAGFPPQPSAKSAAAPPVAAQAQKVSLPPSIAPKIPARSGSGRFMQPVDGKVISGFGPKDDGLHNDGINIKAAKGTAVRAAENGVVAYTGNEMSGYGNLVLIRHADRWMTAYAHMDKTLVKKGDVVKAGQSIGTVGATGQVESPQLHFEVRKGTQAVDPKLYL